MRRSFWRSPAHGAAALLRPVDGDLADELAAIPYASSAIVTFAFRREEIPHPLDGFGFRRSATSSVARCWRARSAVSSTPGRAPAEFVLVRAFVGGALQPELVELDDGELLARIRHELTELLGIRAQPILSRIARWPQAMPQYHVGHLERVARIDSPGRRPARPSAGRQRLRRRRHSGLYSHGRGCRRAPRRCPFRVIEANDQLLRSVSHRLRRKQNQAFDWSPLTTSRTCRPPWHRFRHRMCPEPTKLTCFFPSNQQKVGALSDCMQVGRGRNIPAGQTGVV